MSENRDSDRKPEQKPKQKPILPPKKPQGSTGSARKDNTDAKTDTKRK